nr:hypothetical protein [Streptococcus gallolyticus]
MFDNINFEHLKLSRTKHSFNEQANNNLSKEFKNNQYSFSNFYTDEKNYIDFVLDGDSYTIIPKNISDFAKDHLIFLQCFSIIDAYKNFYTDRINFPSYLLVYTYEGTGELFYQNQKYVLSVGQGFFLLFVKYINAWDINYF